MQPRAHRRRSRLILSGVALPIVTLFGIGLASTTVAAMDESQIRTVVTGALHAQQEVGLPPGSYLGGAMPAEVTASMAAAGDAELAKFFAGPQLEYARAVLAANIEAQSSGQIRTLAAGIKNIAITSIDVDGDVAHVAATGTVWAQFAQVQEGKLVPANPDNGMIYTLTLERSAAGWFVVDETRDYAPGEEP